MRNRINKSMSFDPNNLMCNICVRGGHPALRTDANGPTVLVGTDQCFPACTPSKDDGECIKIVRVEDGSLQDIMYALADAVGSNKLANGSVLTHVGVNIISGRGGHCTVSD